MLPILLSLGPVKFIPLAWCWCWPFSWLVISFWRKGREEHFPEDELFDGYLLALLVGVVASRLGFIVFSFWQLWFRCLEVV